MWLSFLVESNSPWEVIDLTWSWHLIRPQFALISFFVAKCCHVLRLFITVGSINIVMAIQADKQHAYSARDGPRVKINDTIITMSCSKVCLPLQMEGFEIFKLSCGSINLHFALIKYIYFLLCVFLKCNEISLRVAKNSFSLLMILITITCLLAIFC